MFLKGHDVKVNNQPSIAFDEELNKKNSNAKEISSACNDGKTEINLSDSSKDRIDRHITEEETKALGKKLSEENRQTWLATPRLQEILKQKEKENNRSKMKPFDDTWIGL